MFDSRIYRAAFAPLLFVLVIVGFSLAGRPQALRSSLAPDAFDGTRAFAELQRLARAYPDRQPGSAGDNRLASAIAQSLRELGGAAAGGFQVTTRQIQAQTIDGERTLTTVIAERPGSTGLSPIAILAHRDAAGRGSVAELSGTATLLELARVFSQSETRRTIVLVSTSGGSGGDAGAADFVRPGSQPPDAAIVLGDLAGNAARKPFVLPFSSDLGMAPESLARTLDSTVSQEVGTDPGAPDVSAQLAHLVFPLTTGEQAQLDAAGVPAVLVQVSGERGPASNEGVSATRLLNFGRSVLSATYALDEAPDIAPRFEAHLLFGRKTLPGWAIRLLALALLLPPLLVSVDALARLRRRREPILRRAVWVLSAALPFFVCALFALLLGLTGIVAAPAGQLATGSLSIDGSAVSATAGTALILMLGLLAWPAFVRRLALPLRPGSDGAALSVMLLLNVVAAIAWIFNPFTCLLLIPALHLWLVAVGPARAANPGARALGLGAVLVSILPLLLLLTVYAHQLGLGATALGESVVLALAGGQLNLFAMLLWSVAFGCLLAVVLISPSAESMETIADSQWTEISTRGPASYAGPGSLGGTESALRR